MFVVEKVCDQLDLKGYNFFRCLGGLKHTFNT